MRSAGDGEHGPAGATLEVSGLASSLAAAGRPSPGLYLKVESGPAAGLTRAIGTGAIVIGSADDCDLQIQEPGVSRHHAQAAPTRGGARLRDLGSTNGTFVADARVLEAVVDVGTSFQLGNTQLRLLDMGVAQLPPSRREWFGGLRGDSVAMREIFALLERAAPSEATVLIEGASGTGKEVAARALHEHSPRAAGPFVVFDCSVVSRELLQSALMGHLKGAFTGADRERPGALIEANGGTLFLDEIGEMPLESQAHLLRALESRQVTPVGSDRARAVDVRVVAATNRSLYDMVEARSFRLDLFHRLAVVHLRMPSLRQHLDDLPVLVAEIYRRQGAEPGPIDGPNLDQLRRHPFEGNVRELRNIVERSLVLAEPEQRAFRDLHLLMGPPGLAQPPAGPRVTLDLPYLIRRYQGNVSQAARHAGLSRQHLTALLDKHGLKPSGQ